VEIDDLVDVGGEEEAEEIETMNNINEGLEDGEIVEGEGRRRNL
jgi:hypothetical protein